MRPKLLTIALAALLVAAAGCGEGVDTTHVTSEAVTPLSRAPLSDAAAKRVVGVGEATHGNKEFAQTRKLIIQKLVREHGFRTVALEADFGGTAEADDYVMGGRGSAEDAAKALGFDIYRTRETADLLRWIRDHNATTPEEHDKVRLYGFDMQRYDHNKKRLLRYLAKAAPAVARQTETSLAALTDASRSKQPTERTIAAADHLVTHLKQDRAKYMNAGSPEEYTLALHHAETIQHGAQLQTSANDYARKRDTWMAENIKWITEAQGRKNIVVAAHNSHLDKTGAAFSFESMGVHLTRTYGDDYFVIATEFGTNTFISKDDGTGKRTRFTVTNDSPLAKLFGNEPLGYVNLTQAATNPANRDLLTSKLPMGSIGDGFRSLYSSISRAYTVPTVPADAYDALVFVPRASPVSPL